MRRAQQTNRKMANKMNRYSREEEAHMKRCPTDSKLKL